MKRFIFVAMSFALTAGAFAQSAIDAYRLSQPDMKGTARYMSMGGAFGALGGDLSTLSHNPAGIGVYRNNDFGVTVDLDLQHAESSADGFSNGVDQTKFLLNNIGFVWTIKIPSSNCPNINFGFTYNKNASFNRRYRGVFNLNNSLSNYIAAMTTAGGFQEGQLVGDEYNNYDPYNPSNPSDAAPWLSILGYQGYLFSLSPQSLATGGTDYVGQWGSNTYGEGYFNVQESGAIDSYNIALGGNIANVVYWGMDFDITHMNYNLTPQWTENLGNARVGDNDGIIRQMDAFWTLSNYYNCSGTGFNYKLGFIVKPIQELRLGFAFQTPTWYGLTETFYGDVNYLYAQQLQGQVGTNEGYDAFNNINFRSPWKINVSAAAVLLNRLILSAEYEWTQYKGMKYSYPSFSGGDYWYPDDYYPWDYPWYYSSNGANYDPFISNDPFYSTNNNVKEYYRNTNTLRLGAEFRLLPQFSIRAGYCFVSSPTEEKIKNREVETAGTIPNYRFDNTTNYVTCGLGYRIKAFYMDLAYVYKHMSSDYHAYSPWYNSNQLITSPVSSLSLSNSQIVLTAGFKF